MQEAGISPSSFQLRAGFQEEEDWLDTILVEGAHQPATIREWLQEQGIDAQTLLGAAAAPQPGPTEPLPAQIR